MSSRRGVLLLLVMVVVAISALIGGAAASLAATERGSASAAREVAQARLVAWSGVQAVMAELGDQREALLAGEAPVLTESWDLFEGPDGRRGVVRLVDLTPAEDGVAVAESGKLCVNKATAAMLVDLGVDEGLAGRIVAAREAGEFGSVEGLLRVPGVTASMLGGAPVGAEGDEAASGEGEPAAGTDLSRVLTVFAFDPNVQSGVGESGEAFRGRLRVNLDQEWSPRLEDALTERFGAEAAAGIKRIMDQGTTFKDDSDVVATLRRLGLRPETWAEVLDVFTTSDDEYLIGRVDLRTAPEAVLAALPGVDEDQAAEIVAARERLAPEAMASPTWLVTEGILLPEQFEQVVDHVTTRCLQWRVRVEGGMVEGTGVEGDMGEMRPRVVYEAVIDVSSQRARVAYLRDVTLLETAVAVLGDVELADEMGVEVVREDEGEGLDASVDPEVENEGRDGGEGGASGDGGGDPWPPMGGERQSPEPEAGRDGTGGGSSGGDGASGFKDRRIGRWATGGGRGGTGLGGGR